MKELVNVALQLKKETNIYKIKILTNEISLTWLSYEREIICGAFKTT